MLKQYDKPSLRDALKRLDGLTDWEKRPRTEMIVGLDPIVDLMHRLGDPQLLFRTIHVTGTKGKGSVCALIEAGLLQAGSKVGRYASPHIESLTERVTILGQPVGDDQLANALGQVMDCFDRAIQDVTPGAAATRFDVLTASALLLFKDAGLTWVVLEVGLGGRLDSTNVVDAEIAIVTNIELEHTEVLGPTREAIVSEKVGILKPGAILLTPLPASDAAGAILQGRADELGCEILRPEISADETIANRNTALAGLALDALGRKGELTSLDSERQVPMGAWLLDTTTRENARLPGRMERSTISLPAGDSVPIVFDGAHVPFNLAAVMKDLAREPQFSGPCVAVVALASDKDAEGFLRVLSERAATVIFTEIPNSALTCSSESLNQLAATMNIDSESVPDAQNALRRAVEFARDNGVWILATGSLHLLGPLRAHNRAH